MTCRPRRWWLVEHKECRESNPHGTHGGTVCCDDVRVPRPGVFGCFLVRSLLTKSNSYQHVHAPRVTPRLYVPRPAARRGGARVSAPPPGPSSLVHALVAYDSRHNTDQLTQTSSPPAAISSSCNPHAVVASPGITRHGITTRPEGTLATSHACVPHRHCTERSPFERWSTNCSPPCTSFGLPTPRPTAWFERSHHLLLHHLASSAIASSAIRLLHHD